jgi:hypothetical protein
MERGFSITVLPDKGYNRLCDEEARMNATAYPHIEMDSDGEPVIKGGGDEGDLNCH